MPSRNVIKTYIENGYYHIYNRGVEKRKIFLDKNDYKVFTHLLKRAVDPNLKTTPMGFINIHSVADEVELICYSLMPNHFHLLIRQRTKNGITKLIRRLLTSYVMYFNKKHNREGALFQGKPRGVLVQKEDYLLHLTRYIHLNPTEIGFKKKIEDYQYSSYADYLELRKNRDWIRTGDILSFFKSRQKTSLKDYFSYQSFVENYKGDSEEILGRFTLEHS